MYSSTVPVTRTRLPTAAVAGGALLVNTNTASDVAGSPSSLAACRKKPLLNLIAVTMPSVTTRLPLCGDSRPLPWIWAMVSASGGSGGSGGSAPLLRGFGAPTAKSAPLLLVSMLPSPPRSAAVVLLSVPVGALPSKQLAALPKPTKSTTFASAVGQAPVSAVVLRLSATLPAVPAMAMVPVASGVGRSTVPPAPCACWIR